MPPYNSAGADAAGEYDQYFRQILANDPEIQAIIRRVWGDTPVDARPSDTPDHLEDANAQASKDIARVLASKGITLPERTFVNPRSASLEGHRGWAGLSGLQKAAIIAAASAAGVGGLAAAGALGGGAAAGGGGAALGGGGGGGAAAGIGGLGSGLTVASGLPAGMAGVGATGLGAGGAALGGGAAAAGGGGSLLGTLGRVGQLGQLASGAASNLRQGRYADAALQTDRDRLAAQNFSTQQNAVFNRNQQELQEKQFSLNAPKTRAQQAALGDVLARIQDVNITPPAGIQMANISGGLRPSVLGPNARQAGDLLSREAVMALLDKRDQKFSPMPLLTPPAISPTPKAGASENILGLLGTLGGVAGGINEIYGRR